MLLRAPEARAAQLEVGDWKEVRSRAAAARHAVAANSHIVLVSVGDLRRLLCAELAAAEAVFLGGQRRLNRAEVGTALHQTTTTSRAPRGSGPFDP